MARPPGFEPPDIVFGVEVEIFLKVRTSLSPLGNPTIRRTVEHHLFDKRGDIKEFAESMTLNYNEAMSADQAWGRRRVLLSRVRRLQNVENQYENWCLEESSYTIEGNEYCSTHVHVSKGVGQRYTLEELKRIAQAAIWWEPAFEAILPPERRGNPWSGSLYVENPNFYSSSRIQAIEQIEQDATNMVRFLAIVQPSSRYMGFNFWNIDGDCGTVEFRRSFYSVSRLDVSMWISIAGSFILAAIGANHYTNFTNEPCTVARLKDFLLQARGQNFQACHIERLFHGKRHWPTDRPLVYRWNNLDPGVQETLQQMTHNDVSQVNEAVRNRDEFNRRFPVTPRPHRNNMSSEWQPSPVRGFPPRFTGRPSPQSRR
ncbi:MAG: hypothetical protein Q9162_004396 [Coniocarpon cinnabarinum]